MWGFVIGLVLGLLTGYFVAGHNARRAERDWRVYRDKWETLRQYIRNKFGEDIEDVM